MPAVSPDTVVRAPVDAYNRRDLEDYLSSFTEDAVLYGPNGDVLDAGLDAMRQTFADIFARMPDLRAEVPVVIGVGEWVAIHAMVRSGTCPTARSRSGSGSRSTASWMARSPRFASSAR
jgi:hypothetical protein